MLRVLAVEGYRSLRRVIVPLGDLTVVTGPNGSGKSSLYRALRLLADTAHNGAVRALASEGGLTSVLWAGQRSGKYPVALRLGFGGDDFGYSMEMGMPADSWFPLDPDIKVEAIWAGPALRPSALLSDRRNSIVRVRNENGKWGVIEQRLTPFDSMLSETGDSRTAPEVLRVREQVRSWRFYDHLPTDAAAPARSPRPATRTTVLAADGADLAAALATIERLGDGQALDRAVDRAFPGSQLVVGRSAVVDDDGVTEHPAWLEVTIRQPGMVRPLSIAELSEGTLRYLMLVAVLLSPRPPELLVLNEPEAHLHPALLEPLGELILSAAETTQIVVVSHAPALTDALRNADDGSLDIKMVTLRKDAGETVVEGLGLLDERPWQWPKR